MSPFNPGYPTLSPAEVGSQSVISDDSEENAVYDYIVVGGGTAGAVVASRLSEDPSVRVLLVERGEAVDTWASRVPLLSANYQAKGSPADRFSCAPLDNVDGRALEMVLGKALGGGSRINGQVYTRSSAADFNRWSECGRQGWSYDEVEPFFTKSEGYLGLPVPKNHGSNGPWKIQPFKKFFFKSTALCAEAAQLLGIPLVDDINSPTAPAVACTKLHTTIDGEAHRSSTFHAFLPLDVAIARKDHLKICTGSVATSLHIQKGRVVGVFFEREQSESDTGRTFYACARREVVVCCGAIGSPQLLMLSGIGPASHLKSLGIEVVKDLPGVGSNLQDHFGVSTMFQIPLKDSFHIVRDRPLRAMQEFLKYLVKGDGLFLCPITQISIFLRSALLGDDLSLHNADSSQLDSTLSTNIPDIEIMPVSYNTTDYEVEPGTGLLSFLAVLLQPNSRGTVRLVSRDPLVRPTCDLGFLSDPRDRALIKTAVKFSKRIAEKMREQGYPMADQNVPTSESGADLDAFVNKSARSTFHYSSTCRMAPENDPQPGVVDDRLRVYGVQNLRIADCSIFPDILSNHLQAPAAMVAEKCAHMILEDASS
ncbi:GMC oxidoreductase [Mycena sp. CBHHK59/15]|nr:GMC oxidoreductase [Mycena sp. CBHHK59/15]